MFNPTGATGAAGGDSGMAAALETRILGVRPANLIALLLSASGAERFRP